MMVSLRKEYPGKWVEVCSMEDLIEGEAQTFKVGSYEVYVVYSDGRLKTYYGRCPHAFGEFAPSDFDGRKIVCNMHQWEFDAFTGEGLNPRGTQLFELEHEVRDGVLYVKVPDMPVVEFKEKWFRMYTGL